MTRHTMVPRRRVVAMAVAVLVAAAGGVAAQDNETFSLHRATAGNTSGYITHIDHVAANGDPAALVFVTANWNPGGQGGVYNDHACGVYFEPSLWTIYNEDIAAMPAGAAFNILVPMAGQGAFVHFATGASTTGNVTQINNPRSNGNPDALVFVTHTWNPPGGSGIYSNHTTGVWYDTVGSTWGVFNQDLANITVGDAFNVLVADPSETAFVHTATPANITSNWTVIDHPLLNSDPDAELLVTQNWNPGGVGGTYNDHEVGVWYDGSRWAIYNQDLAAMTNGAAFNVLVHAGRRISMPHKATAANTFGNWTEFSNPRTNGHPDALALVTQNWNPGGVGGVYNPHEIGLWYNSVGWAVFNQDLANIPSHAAFNVLIPPADFTTFPVLADAGNTSGHVTLIDHPLLNGNPDAILHATQNWSLPGGGVYNDHPIGVFNTGSRWAVFNQDIANIPFGAGFNLSLAPVNASSYVHTATAGNTAGQITYLSHPMLNGHPFAEVMVTQNWNPGGVGGVYNAHPIGVFYAGSVWAVFNQDLGPMPVGASFNVSIFDTTIFLGDFETGGTGQWSAAVP